MSLMTSDEAREVAREIVQQLATDGRIEEPDEEDEEALAAAEVRVTVGDLTRTLVAVLVSWS